MQYFFSILKLADDFSMYTDGSKEHFLVHIYGYVKDYGTPNVTKI